MAESTLVNTSDMLGDCERLQFLAMSKYLRLSQKGRGGIQRLAMNSSRGLNKDDGKGGVRVVPTWWRWCN
jgi:hypothetical protein